MNILNINIPKQIVILLLLPLILIIARVVVFGSFSLIYISWNIFLATLPFIISSLLLSQAKKNNLSKTLFIIVGIFWLLLLPNAPYIVTDLIHIGVVRSVPAFYDSILLFSSAWVGMILGMNSIFHIEQIFRMSYSKTVTNIIIAIIIFFTSFGVYLGRFLRFNSWDIFLNHLSVLKGILKTLSNTTNPLGIYFYLPLFFFFMYFSYIAWKYNQIK